MEELVPCGVCRNMHPMEELFVFDDQLLCDDCLSDETTICERCGDRIWADDDAGDEHIHLCQRCYDRYYTRCSRCGIVISEVDAFYQDDDCDDALCDACNRRELDSRPIRDYYYKPDPLFYGEGNRYFGVELEIDEAGESNTAAGKLLAIANAQDEHLYCKHDGSLEDGFELVTHPMTLDYHLNRFPWDQLLSKARSMGYTSHQARTCGLHVHVNRTAFGETEETQDECIARVLYFFEKNWEELLRFSRRTRSQLERWAMRYGYKDHPKELLKEVKKGYHGERYTSVNLCNTNTIEFRIFRGTLKLNTLLATLQMIHRICDVALYLSDEEIKAMTWSTFVSGCSEYPELVQYLKERRLYVNEPVEMEEEI